MTSFVADRIRQERRKTGKNQSDFAALAGVSRNAQVEYETGKTAPNTTYLTRLAAHGVDVAYIVTGSKSADSLDSADVELLEKISRLTNAHRQAVATVIEGLASKLFEGAPLDND